MIQSVQSFIEGPEFWWWHGWVLTTLWVCVSAFGIFLKKFNTTLHVLSFAIMDFTTLFFAGTASYRIFPMLSSFAEWHWMKQVHVSGGCMFLLFVIVQHYCGLKAFLGKRTSPQHRAFGRPLATIGRIIVAFGWALAGNFRMVNLVTIIALAVLMYHFFFEGAAKASHPEAKLERKNE